MMVLNKIYKQIFLLSCVIITANIFINYIGNFFDTLLLIPTYAFFIIITSLVLALFSMILENFLDYAAYFYVATYLLKIILVVIYLKILDKIFTYPNAFLFNFGVIYLIYKFFSMFLAFKALNNKN